MINERVDIELPRSWAELDDSRLRFVYRMISEGFAGDGLCLLCLMRWGNIEVVSKWNDGYLLRCRKREFVLSKGAVLNAARALEFLKEPSPLPVRISRIGRATALTADLQGVEFKRFLFLENLYQGFLLKQDDRLLQQMGELLYPKLKRHMNDAEKIGTFFWWLSLKSHFSRLWPNFYRPSADNENLLGEKPMPLLLQEAMNAQIRALTGGDITKEETILSMDTWRALTELDAKARECAEMEARYGKKN